MKLVIHPAVDDDRRRAIEAAAAPMQVVNATSLDQARTAIADADAFFGKLTPELLSASRQLRWVQSPTASLEHFLFPELIEHPAIVTNMRGLYNDVIAEHVLGLMLCFTRHLHTYVRQQVVGKWEPIGGEATRASFATGPGEMTDIDRAHRNLGDLTAGIVGLGSIGREIARRLASFDMRVLAVDPLQQPALNGVEAMWDLDELPRLLGESDFVIIAAPHTPRSAQMFRRAQFQAMRNDAYLINIGRGAIVNLADLVAALEARELAGAALDVFEIEPLPPDHPLWRMPNVILTPHVAGQSPRVPARHLAVVVDNVKRFVRGEPLVNVVDKREWF